MPFLSTAPNEGAKEPTAASPPAEKASAPAETTKFGAKPAAAAAAPSKAGAGPGGEPKLGGSPSGSAKPGGAVIGAAKLAAGAKPAAAPSTAKPAAPTSAAAKPIPRPAAGSSPTAAKPAVASGDAAKKPVTIPPPAAPVKATPSEKNASTEPSTPAATSKANEEAAAPPAKVEAQSGGDTSSVVETSPAGVPEVSIQQYAAIAAEIAIKEGQRDAVLKAHGFSEPAWIAVEDRWADAMAKAMEGGDRATLEAFDAAYLATQERLGKRIGVEEYARILVGIERGEVGSVLAALELKLSDLVRVQRVWAKRLGETPALGLEVEKAVEAARAPKA